MADMDMADVERSGDMEMGDLEEEMGDQEEMRDMEGMRDQEESVSPGVYRPAMVQPGAR